LVYELAESSAELLEHSLVQAEVAWKAAAMALQLAMLSVDSKGLLMEITLAR